jgi:hypothetical protein
MTKIMSWSELVEERFAKCHHFKPVEVIDAIYNSFSEADRQAGIRLITFKDDETTYSFDNLRSMTEAMVEAVLLAKDAEGHRIYYYATPLAVINNDDEDHDDDWQHWTWFHRDVATPEEMEAFANLLQARGRRKLDNARQIRKWLDAGGRP